MTGHTDGSLPPRTSTRMINGGPRAILESAGKPRRSGRPLRNGFTPLEPLEPRVLLAVDHPSFAVPPVGDVLLLNGLGQVSMVGSTDRGHGGPLSDGDFYDDDDVYRFTAPATDFVSVLADTTATATTSSLDTRVEIYDAAGVKLAQGGNNGILSTTRPAITPDGWAGFLAEAGQSYFVRVLGRLTAPLASAAQYTLRIDAQTDSLNTPARFDPMTGEVPLVMGVRQRVMGMITITQGETIYRLTTPNTPALYDGMATVTAGAAAADLDTHLDIYDQLGNLITTDIEGGFQTSAFSVFHASPNSTYYIRVRGDDLRNPATNPSTGAYALDFDFGARPLATPVDPVTRIGVDNDALADAQHSVLYRFTAQGVGTTFITAVPTAAPHDLTLRLYDNTGNFIGFSDNFNGTNPQIELQLTGGQQYFVIVEGFNDAASGPFGLTVESHHTFASVDDHIDTPAAVQTPTALQTIARKRAFELATPLAFGPARKILDADRNPIDHTIVTDAQGRGRIYQAGDTDLFQFTAPVDMLSEYAGNNDNTGSALYLGGRFNFSDPGNVYPRNTRASSIWDANDYWYTGNVSQIPGAAPGTLFGFNNNANTPATASAEIYTQRVWQAGTPGAPTTPLLVVGGDFRLTIPGPMGPVDIFNLAVWSFNPLSGKYEWSGAGDPNGPVHALEIYDAGAFDPDGTPGAPTGQTPPPNQPVVLDTFPASLFVGGLFTTIAGVGVSNLARFSFANGWEALGGGVNGQVNSFAVFNPDDPGDVRQDSMGPPVLTFVQDTPDPPSLLFIGGAFTGGIRTWNGVALGNAAFGTPAPTATINGTVNAMTVFDAPDPDGAGPFMDPGPVLVIGGQFTQAFGVAANNIVRLGRKATIDPGPGRPNGDANADPTLAVYRPRLVAEPLTSGVNNTIFALQVWDVPDINGLMNPPVLVVGGAFTDKGSRIAAWGGDAPNFGWTQLSGGVDGTVRSLAAFMEPQEQLSRPIPTNIAVVEYPRQVVYAGGDFHNVITAGGPVPANHVGIFDFFAGPPAGFDWKPLKSGVGVAAPANAMTDTGTVFSLVEFDDSNPTFDNSATQWDRNDRPASRPLITLAPTGDSFLNTHVRVYDSNLALIYENETKNPIGNDPSGSLDPSLAPGQNTAWVFPVTAQIWAGETYYIEVSGAGTGRYTLDITMDASPDDVNADGVHDDYISSIAEPRPSTAFIGTLPTPAEFQAAPQVFLDDAIGGAGNGRIYRNAAGGNPNGYDIRTFPETPTFVGIRQFSDLGTISRIDDTDIYFFRAPNDGSVEVRLGTTALADEYQEVETDNLTGNRTQRPKTKTYDSYLDAALTIYNNDFEVLAQNDDNPAVTGERDIVPTIGNSGPRAYKHRDPRAVFSVHKGEVYFIRVASGQFFKAPLSPMGVLDTSRVDWRNAVGSYELLVNATPNLQFDDHDNGGAPTVIGVGVGDTSPGQPLNGAGFVTGVIDNTPNNPDDVDTFYYYAPTSGVQQFRVAATDPNSTLRVQVTIVNSLDGMTVATGATTPGAATTLSFNSEQGVPYFIAVDGVGATEGAYSITVSTNPYADDHASTGDWNHATPLSIQGYLGSAVVNGTIEAPADSDIFTFTAINYEVASVRVHTLSTTLDPVVLVYEINSDNQVSAAGDPTFLLVGANNDAQAGSTDSFVTFSVSRGRPYFIVVRGLAQGGHDPATGILLTGDLGAYQITLQTTPTDDYPNLSNYPIATDLNLQYTPLAGLGSANLTGILETPADDDFFVFTAPTRSRATITVTTPSSGLAPMVELRQANPDTTDLANPTVLLVPAASGANGTATISVTGLVSGRRYYIRVLPGTAGAGQPDLSGGYTLSVSTTAEDDHPNAGQFNLVSANDTIVIGASSTGTGAGELLPGTDSDLFRFTSTAAGTVRVALTTPTSGLDPQLTLFNAAGQQVAFSTGDADAVSLTISTGGAGEVYFVLVEHDNAATANATVGAYSVAVTQQTGGGGGGGQPPDDHANAGQFGSATAFALDARTGDGARTGIIDYIGDTDLFTFTSPAGGPVDIQVLVPGGGRLDASVRVYDATQTQLFFDSTGLPGSTAALRFNAAAGQTFFVLVEPIGTNVGAYTLKLDATPATHFLYYPDGFANSRISEFVPLVNTNPFPVSYVIHARYEVGEADQVIATGTIPASSRGGVTVSRPEWYAAGDATNIRDLDLGRPGVRKDTPYAIEVQSDGLLGGTFSHYDFGSTVGESFTNRTSTVWTFSELKKDPNPNGFRDFFLWYNPNAQNAALTISLYYDDGTVTTFNRTAEGLRRGGINFNDDGANFRSGVFAMKVTSTLPVVASITGYDLALHRARGLLGNPNGGDTRGVVPIVSQGSGVDASFSIFNAGDSAASVRVLARYTQIDIPDREVTINIAARHRVSMTLAEFGLTDSQQAGLTYTSTVPVTFTEVQYFNNAGDGAPTATEAARTYVIGDAFINPASAGITYIETLGLYNPAAVDVNITVTYLFNDGATASRIINIAPGQFARVQVDQDALVVGRPGLQYFSIQLDGATPFTASFAHTDLFLNGGWNALGAPVGLTTPLSLIS